MTRALTYSLATAGLLILGASWATAQLPGKSSDGFSRTEVKSIRAIKGTTGCPEFEATFTGPLRSQPNARLDIESSFGLQATISRLLEVFTVGPDRVRLSLRDPEACRILREKGNSVSISVENAQDTEGRTILPNEKSFTFK